MSKTKQITLKTSITGILIALYFICDRFLAINMLTNEYKLSFIPLIIASVFLGPVYGALVGGIGDVLSSLIIPIGPYFPGFTIVSVIKGLAVGFLCHKKMNYGRIAASTFISQAVCGLVLNTFNLCFYMIVNDITKYGTTVFAIYGSLFATRIIQAVIYFAVETLFMIIVYKSKPSLDNAFQIKKFNSAVKTEKESKKV